MRHRLDDELPNCSTGDFDAEKTTHDERCIVCDTRVPAGIYVVRSQDGHPLCTASCIALHGGTRTDSENSLIRKAEGLEMEAEDLRDEADDLERKAEKLREQATEIRLRKEQQLSMKRLLIDIGGGA